ncbi:MAG: ABC transporter substrate-binding protein [Spirochaetales bacterium]|jgi:peptide/nickel transport system substrate-binding protein|nr:ABC transporter substrate-binding protein [Spirochaetales bacterium]
MKRTMLFTLAILLIISTAPLFAGPESEEVVEQASTSQFEGVADVDHTTGWQAGKSGGRFVFSNFGSDPKTFNFFTAGETSSTDVTDRLVSSLVRRNQFTLEYEPDLAESWTVSADQLTITYKLRKGLKWSDGTPITAGDWAYAREIAFLEGIEGSNADGYYVGDVPAEVIAVDDMTVQFVFPEIYAGAFGMAGAPVPTHIYKPVIDAGGVEAFNAFHGVDTDVTKVVSSGPFVVNEYIPSQKVVMGRNPYYYEKDAKGVQLPYIDEFIIIYVEDQDTELEKFLAGELDMLIMRGEDYGVLVGEKEALDMSIYSVGPSTSTNFLTFNQNPIEGEDDTGIEGPKLEWLSTKKFRQAITHLIDKQTIINNIVYGFGYPQYSFVPRFSPYYWDGIDDFALKYDPEKAKQLLDEIDYKDRDGDGIREDPKGNKISLILNTNSGNSDREAIGELIAQEAAAVGIDITFKPEDFNALVTRLVSTHDWDMIIIGLTGSIDPVSGTNVYPSRGQYHMIEPRQESPRRDWEKLVDAAWDEANLTLDDAQRKRGFEKVQRAWSEELPWAYTYNAAILHAYKNKWGNLYPQPSEGYDWEGILHRVYLK